MKKNELFTLASALLSSISIFYAFSAAENPKSAVITTGSSAFQSPFFNELAPENFDTAGSSYYDINANRRNPRQIAFVPSNRNVGIAYARSLDAGLSIRDVVGTLWKGASKLAADVIYGKPMDSGLVGRSGFCGMTYLPKSGRLVIYGHNANDPKGTEFAVEQTAGGFDWTTDQGVPDWIPGDLDPGIWPTAAGGFLIDALDYDKDGNTAESLETIHFFMNEGNLAGYTVDHYIYSRAVDSAGIWIFPGFIDDTAVVVDTGIQICPTVVASKTSQKVALIYTTERQCYFYPEICSDVYLLESTNGGQDWASAGFDFSSFPGLNLTNFDNSDTSRPTGDMMGVYDQSDSLVIAWAQWTDVDMNQGSVSRETDIYVWTKAGGIVKAVDGDFRKTGNPSGTLPRRMETINFPHLAIHDGTGNSSRQNYYYLTYLQYGGMDPASASDTNADGYLNGEIHITLSTDGGITWSSGWNVTRSKTPNCEALGGGNGTCGGVNYVSCAEIADDTIHIAYMSDEFSGTLVDGDNSPGEGTLNEIIYMKYPAFDTNPTPDLTIQAFSPVNLVVVDPDMDSIGVDFNDSIPDAYYTPFDLVYIPQLEPGRHLIRVVDDPALPSGKYSLQLSIGTMADHLLASNQNTPGPGESHLYDLTVDHSTPHCLSQPGDANADGSRTLSDVISTVNYIFNKPGCGAIPVCWFKGLFCRGDWDGSTTVTLSDVIRGVNYIFNKPGGPWNAVPSGVCCL